jgi:hypothetical protein
MLSHERGNPDTEVSRTLSARHQVGYPAREGEGMPKAARGSDSPIVCAGRRIDQEG